MKNPTVITDVEFGLMINAAAEILTEHAESINKLNVFPVPDGDTGTNMSLSMQSGAEYERNEVQTNVASLAAATSKGLLMGARGNSGVILSQIFRGFSQSVEGKSELTATDFAEALKNGATVAYKAVMTPTEGTILTVIRLAAEAADEKASDNGTVVEVAQAAFEGSKKALESTPDLLPILKEVGVVDSGGQGLVLIFQAFYQSLSGEVEQASLKTAPDNANFDQMTKEFDAQAVLDPNDIEFGYCTTILVRKEVGTTFDHKWNYDQFYDHLADLGDSLLVIDDDEVVKVHVHVEDPGEVLKWGTHFGSLMSVKIDNMRDQQQEVIDRVAAENKENQSSIQVLTKAPAIAVVTTASGEGIFQLFESMGATTIIPGGQTMNPSTQDFVEAVKLSEAKQAIILPNNSNIFMAAQQAANILTEDDIDVKVVKSKTIQQGLTALLNFNENNDLEENVDEMTDNLTTVKSAEITQAVRATTIDGQKIKKDDFMAIVDGSIVSSNKKIEKVIEDSLKSMLEEDSEIVTIIIGEDGTQDLAEATQKIVKNIDDNVDVEIHIGNQPLYPLLISVE